MADKHRRLIPEDPADAGLPPVDLTGVRSLGRGVAVTIASPGLAALRARLAREWAPWLTVQDRAKRDLPLAGKYSSNSATVMRRHIEWAKRAGITGFIVSWKHSPSRSGACRRNNTKTAGSGQLPAVVGSTSR